MEKKSSIFVLIGYAYIILPILVFFIGYCNTVTAILGTLTIICASYFLYKNRPQLWMPQNKKEWFLIGLLVLISSLWVYLSGIGAFVFQNYDHTARNAIFEKLIALDWPVKSDNGQFLIYYIGFWLPSAVVGKIANNLNIAYFFQYLWAVLGVFLTFYFILVNLKNKSLLPIIVFILFSGLDIAGANLLEILSVHHTPTNLISHMEWWFRGFQFSSMTTQLFWVFNQAIPAWIVTLILFNEKNNKNMIFIYSCMFLSSTLPAIGLLPFLCYLILKNSNDNDIKMLSIEHIKTSVKSCFTLSNILCASFVTLVSYIYLSNNMAAAATNPISDVQSLHFGFFVFWFLTFFILEAGLYLFSVFKMQYKNPVYYICCFCLLVYPFIRVGYASDFCMRATIPALILLYLFVVQALESKEFLRNKLSAILLIILLLVGSFTPVHEISRTVVYTSLGVKKAPSILQGANFYGYVENNKFLKYFGKTKN